MTLLSIFSPCPAHWTGTNYRKYFFREKPKGCAKLEGLGSRKARWGFNSGRNRKTHLLSRGCPVHFLSQPHSKNISPHLFRDACCHDYWETDAFLTCYVKSSSNLESDLEQVAIFSHMLIHALEKSALCLVLKHHLSPHSSESRHLPWAACVTSVFERQGLSSPGLLLIPHLMLRMVATTLLRHICLILHYGSLFPVPKSVLLFIKW